MEGAIADMDENVVQELISQVHMNLTERPHLHVPIQSVPFFPCSLRWHIMFEHVLQVVSQNKLNRSRGAQPRAICAARVTPQGHAAMCCTLILRRSRLIIKGMMHAATTRRSRIHERPSTRTRRSPHIWFFTVMLRALEKMALLTQGTMNVADEGKVAAVTPPRQTVEQQTAKEMLTCVQACRHLPAYDGHGKESRSWPFFASRGQDRTQVEECPERRAVSASST